MNRLTNTVRPTAAYALLRRSASLWLLALLSLFLSPTTRAVEAVCARVKIEIKQELTLERQAFDATMKINNGLDTTKPISISISRNLSNLTCTP